MSGTEQIDEAVARAFGDGATAGDVAADEFYGQGEVGRVKAALREAGFGDDLVERGANLWKQNAYIDFADMCESLQGGFLGAYGPVAGLGSPDVTEDRIREAGRRFDAKQTAVREVFGR